MLNITTDGKNIRGVEKALVRQLCRAYENVKCLKSVIINCIIHQQVLYRNYLNFSYATEPVLSVMNFICCCRLSHHECLLEIEVEYPDLPYSIAF